MLMNSCGDYCLLCINTEQSFARVEITPQLCYQDERQVDWPAFIGTLVIYQLAGDFELQHNTTSGNLTLTHVVDRKPTVY